MSRTAAANLFPATGDDDGDNNDDDDDGDNIPAMTSRVAGCKTAWLPQAARGLAGAWPPVTEGISSLCTPYSHPLPSNATGNVACC